MKDLTRYLGGDIATDAFVDFRAFDKHNLEGVLRVLRKLDRGDRKTRPPADNNLIIAGLVKPLENFFQLMFGSISGFEAINDNAKVALLTPPLLGRPVATNHPDVQNLFQMVHGEEKSMNDRGGQV